MFHAFTSGFFHLASIWQVLDKCWPRISCPCSHRFWHVLACGDTAAPLDHLVHVLPCIHVVSLLCWLHLLLSSGLRTAPHFQWPGRPLSTGCSHAGQASRIQEPLLSHATLVQGPCTVVGIATGLGIAVPHPARKFAQTRYPGTGTVYCSRGQRRCARYPGTGTVSHRLCSRASHGTVPASAGFGVHRGTRAPCLLPTLDGSIASRQHGCVEQHRSASASPCTYGGL